MEGFRVSELRSFTGRGVEFYQMLVLASALDLYAKTGIKANRSYTPRNMMAEAQRILKAKMGGRQYRMAAALLREKAEGMRAELLATGEIK
jgi:hypothetical protein